MLYVYAVPVFAPEEAERIEAFRRRHEPDRAALLPAHVTLVFGVRSITADELTARTMTLAASRPPFDVTLDGSTTFADAARGEFALFLSVGEGREVITALHRQFYVGPIKSELLADAPFDPHVTIASAGSVAPIAVAASEVAGLRLPIRGRVEVLQIARLDAGQLHPVSSIALTWPPGLP